MINYIPGPEQTINPVISELGSSLMKVMNPHYDLQMGMQKAMAERPELLQSLANMEYSNPGTMERMGLGHLADTIGSVGPDLKTQYERANADEILLNEHKKVALDAQKIANESTLAGAEGDALKDPKTKENAASVKLTGKTPDQLSADQSVAEIEGYQAKLAPIKANLETMQMTNAQDFIKDVMGKKVNLYDIASNVEKYDGATIAGAFAAYPQVMPQVFEMARLNKEIAARSDLAALKLGQNHAEQNQAFDMFRNSRGAGSVQAWSLYLKDPEKQQRATDLASGKITSTDPMDMNLKKVGQWASENEQNRYMGLSQSAITRTNSTLNEIRTGKFGSDAERDLKIKEANTLLKQQSDLTKEPLIQVQWDKGEHWWNKAGLVYKKISTSNGKTVTEPIDEGTADKTINSTGSPEVSSTKTDYGTDVFSQRVLSGFPKGLDAQSVTSRWNTVATQERDPARKAYIREQLIKRGFKIPEISNE